MDFYNSGKKIVITAIIAASIGGAIFTVNKANPTLLEKTVGAAAAPVQKFTFRTKDWFVDKLDYFKGISALQEENRQLKDELLTARAESNRLRNVESKNKDLYRLLDMADQFGIPQTIGANVIARDTGNWNKTFIIDKGSKDGLEKNMPVIAADGLVGKINKCGAHYAQVISIINDTDSVSAKSARTNDVGYVTGSTGSESSCVIRFIDESADFMVGDEIITSNLSEIYPEGIAVGKITGMSTDKYSENTAALEPAVDFGHLENVIVICKNFKNIHDSIIPESSSSEESTEARESATQNTSD